MDVDSISDLNGLHQRLALLFEHSIFTFAWYPPTLTRKAPDPTGTVDRC